MIRLSIALAVGLALGGCIRQSTAPRWCYEAVVPVPEQGATCSHRGHKAQVTRDGMLICRCPEVAGESR